MVNPKGVLSKLTWGTRLPYNNLTIQFLRRHYADGPTARQSADGYPKSYLQTWLVCKISHLAIKLFWFLSQST
jgi:hypothetical protein